MKNEQPAPIVAEGAQALSPHNKALYEAGKSMLSESVSIGRDFCKFMITTTIGAIPVYLTILKLVLPQENGLTSSSKVLFVSPVILFLASTVVFIVGYLPQTGNLCLNIPDTIESQRSAVIQRRQKWTKIGFLFFLAAVSLAAWVIVDTPK
jgi:hypothetical protein